MSEAYKLKKNQRKIPTHRVEEPDEMSIDESLPNLLPI
jgi:hypothetical protein